MRRSPVDVRIYQIAGTGTAPNTRCSLQFRTHARSPIVQEIPIVNPTEKDWLIKATFTLPPDVASPVFEGPREILAKKKSTSTYNLTYRPEWVSAQDVCHVALFNVETNETYTKVQN